MIDTECPLCGHKGKVPPKLSGKQIKCKECCNVFHVGGEPAGGTSGSAAGNEKINNLSAGSAAGTEKINPAASAAGNQKLSPTSGSKAGNEKIKVNGKVDEKKRASGDTHHGKMKVQKPSPSQQGNTQKVLKPRKPAALDVLEELPEYQEPVRRRRKRGPSIIPLVISLFLLVAMLIGGFVIYDQMFAVHQTPSSQASATVAPSKEETKGDDTKKEPEAKKEEPPPKDFVDVTQGPFRYGDIIIRVTSAAVAPVAVKGQEPKADVKHFILKLEIENRGSDRVDFQGWGTAEKINQDHPPTMRDASGKEYKWVTFGAGANVDGMVLAESIQPTKLVNDVVVFEVPDAEAPFVRVELSATNFNKKEKVLLQIPKPLYAAGLVAKIDPKKEQPKVDPGKVPEETATVKFLRGSLKKAKTAKDQADLITALGEQGPAAHSALPELITFAKMINEVLQVEAIQALGKIGPVGAMESVPVLGALVMKDPSIKVRIEAAKALGKLGPHAKDALPALIDAAKDKDEELMDQAKAALKLINGE